MIFGKLKIIYNYILYKIDMHLNKKYLITGGTGFLGLKLVEKLSSQGYSIRVLCRDEAKLVYLKEEYPTIETISGDICNRYIVMKAMKNIYGIFHLAAFKYVDLAEKETINCTKSNIIGSLNILEETLKRNDIDFVIATSTDKAAKVAGVYGASKLIMEKLFEEYQSIQRNIKYRIVRYGNVLYSTGSVLYKWKRLLQQNKEVLVTNLNCTRFYWSVDEAITLIFDCLEFAKSSKPYVPKMKSIILYDLLQAMSHKYLMKGGTLKIKEIGLRPGENLHESLDKNHKNSCDSDKYTVEEIMSFI